MTDMRAMLLTPLEAAIIDTLRLSQIGERIAALVVLRLPMPREEYEALLAQYDVRNSENQVWTAKKRRETIATQEKALQLFKVRGYGNKVEFATEPFEI